MSLLATMTTAAVIASGPNVIYEDGMFTAADMAQYGGFGARLALSGDTLVVGASGNDYYGLDAGAAWIFNRTSEGFAQAQIFKGSDTGFLDAFGYSVAIEGDLVVVGARFHPSDGQVNSGAVYVFERDGDGAFAETAKLTAAVPAIDDAFGWDVDTDGDRIVVGARAGNGGTGSAHVFVREGSGWSEQAVLVGEDTDAGDNFGTSVSIDGDTVAVGARYFAAGCSGTNRCGSVFMFAFDGDWSQSNRLTPNDHANEDYFGWIVDLDGDQLLATSIYDDDMGSQSGSGYLFERAGTEWYQAAKFVAPDGMPQDFMGMSGQLAGDHVVLGGWYGNDGAGAAWLWSRTDGAWSYLAEANATDAEGYDIFGRAVALEGDTLLVGADWADIDGVMEAGSVYQFEVPAGTTCDGDANGDGDVNVDDILLVIGAFGESGGDGDVNGDGQVNVNDLLLIIGAFGAC